ncbi:MAG: nitroreductase family protein [Anaerovoracaceae bacterium]
MSFIEKIKSRRSVRKYTDQVINREVVEEIVDAARFSPSWKNTQIVRYYAVEDAKLKSQIAEDCVMDFAFNTKTISRSNMVMVVTFVSGISGYEKDGSFSTPIENGWERFDAGIATQTFCLAAHEKGIGTVILGIFDDKKVKETLGLSDNEKVAALIAMGYPEKSNPAPPRKEVSELLKFL